MDTCLGWAESRRSTLRTKTMILKIQMVECSERYKQLGVQEPVREGLEPRSEAQEETPEILVYHVVSKVASKSWLKSISSLPSSEILANLKARVFALPSSV